MGVIVLVIIVGLFLGGKTLQISDKMRRGK